MCRALSVLTVGSVRGRAAVPGEGVCPSGDGEGITEFAEEMQRGRTSCLWCGANAHVPSKWLGKGQWESECELQALKSHRQTFGRLEPGRVSISGSLCPDWNWL